MISSASILVSELLGTGVMIFLGVSASIALAQRGAGVAAGTAAWAAAVFVGASVADASGAHLNPAITLAQALAGRTEWVNVPAYLLGEAVGSIVGAAIAAAVFGSSIAAARDRTDLVCWFATGTTQPSRPRAALAEAVATGVLVLWVLNPPRPSIEDGVFNFGNSGLGYAGVALVIFVLSIGAGSTTGAALNPFRDLGPRFVYTALHRSRSYASANWRYAVVPVVGPLLGAAGAVAGSALMSLG